MKTLAMVAALTQAALSARAEDGRGFGDAGGFVPSGSLYFVATSIQTTFGIGTSGPSSNLFKDQALIVHTVIGGWF